MSKKPIMSTVAQSGQMASKDNVRQFWIKSTEDFFSEVKTGIDISRKQDNYWKYLDMWEKQIALDNLSEGLTLDMGAGTGRLTNFLRSHGKKVFATDFVFDCLKAIKSIGGQKSSVNMDVMSVGMKDSSIDCVVSCRVLGSLPTKEEKEIAVKEIYRILKNGGKLILTEGNPLRTRIVPVRYNFYLSLTEWINLLNKHGFSIQEIYGIPFLTITKILEKMTFGLSARFEFIYKLASSLDRNLKTSFIKHLSLQFDIIANKN